ncbi:hypothetical protein ACJJIF_09445 [Microbulbifer sp. SSSA002]|uniref:hypothetical protein n=1 Tax=unclassified Microbulbifer TaxID=2619833 RepID=UPI0040397054
MYRFGPSIVLLLALCGCEGPRDSKAPAPPPADAAATRAMKEPIAPPDNLGEVDTAIICTPQWFTQVQQQILAQHSRAMAELYPSGMPATGSGEWFSAISQLSGANTEGLQPGGMAWCEAIQKRLSQDSASPE